MEDEFFDAEEETNSLQNTNTIPRKSIQLENTDQQELQLNKRENESISEVTEDMQHLRVPELIITQPSADAISQDTPNVNRNATGIQPLNMSSLPTYGYTQTPIFSALSQPYSGTDESKTSSKESMTSGELRSDTQRVDGPKQRRDSARKSLPIPPNKAELFRPALLSTASEQNLKIEQAQSPTGITYNQDGTVDILLKNLDTGSYIELEDVVKELHEHGVDPLSLHIMQKYHSKAKDEPGSHGSEEEDEHGDNASSIISKISPVKSLFSKLKLKAEAYRDKGEHVESGIKVKKGRNKHIKEFTRLSCIQELQKVEKPEEHETSKVANNDGKKAIWTMKFNRDGKYLGTSGADPTVKVWIVQPEHGRCPLFDPIPHRSFQGHTSTVCAIAWSKNNFLLSASMDKTVRLWHVSRTECLCVFQHTDFVTTVAFHPQDDRFFVSGSLDGRLRLWNVPEKRISVWSELPDSNVITSAAFSLDGKICIAGSYTGKVYFYNTDGLRYNTQIHVKSTRGKNSEGKKVSAIEAIPGDAANEEKILITTNDSRIRTYLLRDYGLICKYKGLRNLTSQIGASVSDDGTYIICGSEDHNVYIWNTLSSTGRLSRSPSANALGSATDSAPSHSRQHHRLASEDMRGKHTAYECFAVSDTVVTCACFAPTPTSLVYEAAHNSNKSPRTFKKRVQSVLKSQGSRESLNTSMKDVTESLKPRGRSGTILSIDSFGSDGRLIVTADHDGCIRIYYNEPEKLSPEKSEDIPRSGSVDVLRKSTESLAVHSHQKKLSLDDSRSKRNSAVPIPPPLTISCPTCGNANLQKYTGDNSKTIQVCLQCGKVVSAPNS